MREKCLSREKTDKTERARGLGREETEKGNQMRAEVGVGGGPARILNSVAFRVNLLRVIPIVQPSGTRMMTILLTVEPSFFLFFSNVYTSLRCAPPPCTDNIKF